MTPGTSGFAFAGNKFVGSVLQNGTGSLYSSDLNGETIQTFASSGSLTSSNADHCVSASFGLGGFPVGDIYAAMDQIGGVGIVSLADLRRMATSVTILTAGRSNLAHLSKLDTGYSADPLC